MAGYQTRRQVSAGGVVHRGDQVALIGVERGRWQLPKGLVEDGEAPEDAAAREVREETGLEAELVAPLETIEYWYVSKREGVRYHKHVHFFLFRYVSGDVGDHDHEVLEARWVGLDEAQALLTFDNEKRVMARAAEAIRARAARPG